MTNLTHPYIREAFSNLCASYEVQFKDNNYNNITVIGMKKPSWQSILTKANEIELTVLKPFFLREAKMLETEARQKLVGENSTIIVSHWNNQKIIADKILKGNGKESYSATEEEKTIFQIEINLRGLNETLKDFALKVVEKSNVYTYKNSVISGSVKKILSDIENATTKDFLITQFTIFKEAILKL